MSDRVRTSPIEGLSVAEPFLTEIRVFSFNFPPEGWAFCNGQLLPVNRNQAMFALLGTTYGGNGQTNFGLPNLQARVPIHEGNGHTFGEAAGETAHTVTTAEMPMHTHLMSATATQSDVNNGNLPIPGNWLAGSAGQDVDGPASDLTPMAAGGVGMAGGSQPHTNVQPYLVLNFCIALQGIFPSANIRISPMYGCAMGHALLVRARGGGGRLQRHPHDAADPRPLAPAARLERDGRF